jgi:DNA-binding FrmR family transcriptional regulator
VAALGGLRITPHAAHRIGHPPVIRRGSAMMRVLVLFMMIVTRLTATHFRSPDALAIYTLWGYITDMRDEIKTSCRKRLKRIEGQVRGLADMIEADRYCIDVVTQIAAARAALRRVEEEILRDHVAHCVEHAIASGDKADQRRKITELMDVVSRADR